MAKLDVRQLISWCIADLDSRDATVRSAVRSRHYAVSVLQRLTLWLQCIILADTVTPWYRLVPELHHWCHRMYKGRQRRALVSHSGALSCPYCVLTPSCACATQAVVLLARAHRQLGPGLTDMVRMNVKPVQLATIEEAFVANPLQAVRPGPPTSRHLVPLLLHMGSVHLALPLVCRDAHHARVFSIVQAQTAHRSGCRWCHPGRCGAAPPPRPRGAARAPTLHRQGRPTLRQRCQQTPRTSCPAPTSAPRSRTTSCGGWPAPTGRCVLFPVLHRAAHCCSHAASCLDGKDVLSN